MGYIGWDVKEKRFFCIHIGRYFMNFIIQKRDTVWWKKKKIDRLMLMCTSNFSSYMKNMFCLCVHDLLYTQLYKHKCKQIFIRKYYSLFMDVGIKF